jgi:uncharacterized membrane protein (DUF4010 family)
VALRFAAALGLGVLLGLERERTKTQERFAGVRTFALIALSGALAGFVDGFLGLPALALGVFAAVAGLVLVSYAVSAQQGEYGITTEVSALLAFLIGWLCLRDQIQLAAALAVANAALLALKDWLHRLARRIESADVEATLKFALVTLIILPLVPNQNFGPPPLDVINPYKIWLMVVLISGLNFASYLLVKVVGAEHGLVLTGFLGGLVSSTAVTLGFSQRSLQEPGQSSPLALGILIAWTVMFVRVVVVVALVGRAVAIDLVPAIAVLLVPSLVACVILWRRQPPAERATVSAGENPFELMEAIRFGLVFGVITFVAKAAEVYLGTAGLYLAGAVAGLTDVDAISLSMANLASGGGASVSVAARTIMIAVMANTLVKALMAGFLGAPALRRIILPAGGAILAAGALGMLLV